MAQTIKIKRSTGSAAPSTLASGELAYSKGSDTFYIGDPAAANTPIAVGGAIKNNAGTPVLATGITVTEIQQLLDLEVGVDIDAAGTDNSTNVTLAGTPDYLTLSGQQITLGLIDLTTDVTGALPVANGGTGATTAAGARTALNVDVAGTDNSTDVTLVTTSHDYLSIAGQAITLGAISLADDITGTLAISNGGTGATTAAGARTALNVDVAGTDNSTDVTLVTTTADYLSITGQAITLGLIDLTTDVTGTLPLSSGGTGATTAGGARTALGLGSLATLSAVGANEITDNSVGAAELNVSGNGTAGQALVSDGDGTFSWSTISVTDNDVNVANLTARLPQITESVTIGDATDVTITTSGDLVVTGNLTVSGTTTTVNTETINLADNLITVNSNYTGSSPTEDGGIEVERGTLSNVAVLWDESADRWTFTNDGSTYYNIPISSEYTANTGTVTSVGGTGTVNGITLSGTVTSSGNLTLGGSLSGITISQLEATDLLTSAEAFVDTDDQLMTAAAIDDRILSYGYSTTTGTVTSVSISSTDGSISGTGTITSSGTFDLEVATIDGGTY